MFNHFGQIFVYDNKLGFLSFTLYHLIVKEHSHPLRDAQNIFDQIGKCGRTLPTSLKLILENVGADLLTPWSQGGSNS